jgi:hypothetical protein
MSFSAAAAGPPPHEERRRGMVAPSQDSKASGDGGTEAAYPHFKCQVSSIAEGIPMAEATPVEDSLPITSHSNEERLWRLQNEKLEAQLELERQRADNLQQQQQKQQQQQGRQPASTTPGSAATCCSFSSKQKKLWIALSIVLVVVVVLAVVIAKVAGGPDSTPMVRKVPNPSTVPNPSPVPPPPPTRDELILNYMSCDDPDILCQGRTLNPGGRLVSPNGQYHVEMQPDNNFVVYRQGTGTSRTPLWHSNTWNSGANQAIMQDDGNLVVYADTSAKWKSGTSGQTGNWLRMQDDGNLVVYGSSGTNSPRWASNSDAGRLG